MFEDDLILRRKTYSVIFLEYNSYDNQIITEDLVFSDRKFIPEKSYERPTWQYFLFQ